MKTLKETSSEHICFYIGFSIAATFLILAILQTLGVFWLEHLFPTCFFYTLTQLPCPGCGITRAIQAIFSFDFIASFLYNPVALYCFIFFTCYMISHTSELVLKRSSLSRHFHGMKVHVGYIYIGVVILLVQWVIKMLNIFAF